MTCMSGSQAYAPLLNATTWINSGQDSWPAGYKHAAISCRQNVSTTGSVPPHFEAGKGSGPLTRPSAKCVLGSNSVPRSRKPSSWEDYLGAQTRAPSCSVWMRSGIPCMAVLAHWILGYGAWSAQSRSWRQPLTSRSICFSSPSSHMIDESTTGGCPAPFWLSAPADTGYWKGGWRSYWIPRSAPSPQSGVKGLRSTAKRTNVGEINGWIPSDPTPALCARTELPQRCCSRSARHTSAITRDGAGVSQQNSDSANFLAMTMIWSRRHSPAFVARCGGRMFQKPTRSYASNQNLECPTSPFRFSQAWMKSSESNRSNWTS